MVSFFDRNHVAPQQGPRKNLQAREKQQQEDVQIPNTAIQSPSNTLLAPPGTP